jgi:hypothetical protein
MTCPQIHVPPGNVLERRLSNSIEEARCKSGTRHCDQPGKGFHLPIPGWLGVDGREAPDGCDRRAVRLASQGSRCSSYPIRGWPGTIDADLREMCHLPLAPDHIGDIDHRRLIDPPDFFILTTPRHRSRLARSAALETERASGFLASFGLGTADGFGSTGWLAPPIIGHASVLI